MSARMVLAVKNEGESKEDCEIEIEGRGVGQRNGWLLKAIGRPVKRQETRNGRAGSNSIDYMVD